MYAIYAYIGVVWGVNVGIYGSPMECSGGIPHVFQPVPSPKLTFGSWTLIFGKVYLQGTVVHLH